MGIAARDSDEAMRAFVDEFGLGAMPTLVDDDGDLWGYYGVAFQPAWVLVAPDGSREVVAGALFGDALNERLTALTDQ